MCKCNTQLGHKDCGTDEEVILTVPEFWDYHKETICVDYCLAPVIQHLWDNKIITEGCCCGHNGKYGKPSIILQQDSNHRDGRKVAALISEVDDREINLNSWVLTRIN